MKSELSILIPNYNNRCVELVTKLHQMAMHVAGLQFEIIVADDGSTLLETLAVNRNINAFPNARLIERRQNVGRAAIRNFLAAQARFCWLLFIDSGMSVESETFLNSYLHTDADVVYGGYSVVGDAANLAGNLRYCYETKSLPHHTLARRMAAPYQNFHTSNFLISRRLMLALPFDERFRNYGYEDVFFGKQLQRAGVPITHIDNPIRFSEFESNASFVAKTEESLQTLARFKQELTGFSRLLVIAEKLNHWHVAWLVSFVFKHNKKRWRCKLCSNHPSLLLFNLYKTGYLLQVCNL
ncbi:MAG: glycosyltransferase family 2 protein [Prevotella sp.]|nr:glycosyltransferase family 2 protein [Prevotella sp.]